MFFMRGYFFPKEITLQILNVIIYYSKLKNNHFYAQFFKFSFLALIASPTFIKKFL